ncbi:hypothetical protein DFH11DRAFT_1037984 [Phellopilus nigrolimitatus]|nr:hypothetical protein DFH11DRAFT_1037984 [Phellopilus nigrolimitatus]
MNVSSNRLHVEDAFARHRTPSPERPVSSLRDFPKLQTPYLAALQTSELKDEPFEMKRSSSSTSQISLPTGWKSYIHPKGWVYYFHPDYRLVTDYRIEYHLGLQEFEAALREVDGFPVNRLPKHCELWVDYRLESGRNVAEKLFVDHEKRRLTPKAPVHRAGSITDDGLWQDENINVRQGLMYEQAYWEYIINHPCHASLPAHAEEDAIAALVWYTQDRLLNPEDSIAPYSRELSKDFLDILSSMSDNKETFESSRNRHVKSHLVASILERTAGERLRQHYGQQDARNFLKKTLKLRRDVPDEPHAAPFGLLLSFSMSFLCFGTPYAYLRRINEFFMSGPGRTDTITERWQAFVDENVIDWTNTNLVATVLISASVALLAIPGIDSVTRILGIMSTLFSIASIIVGLLNVWQHQHKTRSNLELTVIFDFFAKAERLVKTDKLLAVLLSLPMVLLIWSALMFAVSMVTFSWLGVDETAIEANGGEGGSLNDAKFGLPTAWAVTGCMSFLTTLVLLSFLYFWRVRAASSPGLSSSCPYSPITIIFGARRWIPFRH